MDEEDLVEVVDRHVEVEEVCCIGLEELCIGLGVWEGGIGRVGWKSGVDGNWFAVGRP